ncbi:MAG: universal stress protein, partial [Deltaproteobacteria bacterium]|nr:universal stress protein [Deltaproteobacteria bacterium]
MITIKRILVPTDFSDVSVPAIGYAISLAKDHGAEVIVLHTLPDEAVKEYFPERYVSPELALPGQTPIGAGRLPNPEDLFNSTKQVLHTFLEQKIGPRLLQTVKIKPLIRFGKVVKEILATV